MAQYRGFARWLACSITTCCLLEKVVTSSAVRSSGIHQTDGNTMDPPEMLLLMLTCFLLWHIISLMLRSIREETIEYTLDHLRYNTYTSAGLRRSSCLRVSRHVVHIESSEPAAAEHQTAINHTTP
ncbi:hypothetical protein B0H10DRAFT_2052701, partial [Mycena sp. CBHHK59/15]